MFCASACGIPKGVNLSKVDHHHHHPFPVILKALEIKMLRLVSFSFCVNNSFSIFQLSH